MLNEKSGGKGRLKVDFLLNITLQNMTENLTLLIFDLTEINARILRLFNRILARFCFRILKKTVKSNHNYIQRQSLKDYKHDKRSQFSQSVMSKVVYAEPFIDHRGNNIRRIFRSKNFRSLIKSLHFYIFT